MKHLLLIFLLICSFSSFAKKFRTSYVSFDLLNNWHCYPEGTEWICTNKLNRKKASEAMIILTAKQKGPIDSLAQYIRHLKAPRTVKKSGGGSFKSKVFHAKQRQINQHMWVDGFHQGSEVPAYYTRYLVTVKGALAVLVTYSAHKDHYKKYASDFSNSINSLRLLNVSSSFAGSKGGSMGMGGLQDHIQGLIDADDELEGMGEGGEGSGSGGLMDLVMKPEVLGGLGIIAGLLTHLFLKRKRRKNIERQESRSSRDPNDKRRSSRSSSDRRRSSSSSRSRSSSRRRRR